MSRNRKIKVHKPHKWLKRFLYLFLICIGIIVGVLFAGIMYINTRLESLPVIDAQYLTTYETSKIVDCNGETIWQPTEQRIATFTYDEIPEFYETALITVEDEDFWTNNGYSVRGIANMLYSVVRNKVDSSYTPRGGSTIDQQLIKNRYYNGGEGYETTTRKIQELFLAVQLNENFTKEEILTYYVNGLEFAEGSVGTKAIMKTYFGKEPEDYIDRTIENITEQAYLAGLSQAPSKYNLYTDPEQARKRTDIVLTILHEKELLTDKEYKSALEFDLTTNLQPRHWESDIQREKNLKYKVYTDGVMDEIESLGYNINEVSVTVQTYLDPTVFDQITNLVRDPKYYLDENQQSAVTVIDHDGIVVAMVGSTNNTDELNRAMQNTRSSGSSAKPFTAYAPLLQYFGDTYNTASLFDTSNYSYPGSSAIMRNAGGGTYGFVDMQKSLRASYNTPVGRIADEILGSRRMKTFLNGVGLDIQDSYSSVDAIGLNISTLQSAAAYNALNNLGAYTEPRFVKSITFSDNTIKEIEPKTTQAMNQSTAWVINHMLQGIPGSSIASKAGISDYEGYAGKTGSVKFDSSVSAPKTYGDGSSDVWYCSYTNGGYAVSVWVGYDTPNTSPRIPDYYKGQQEINRDIQLLLNGDNKPASWEIPDNVVKLSGDGLNAQYKITDASDINSSAITWTAVENYELADIETATPNTQIPEDWEDYELSEWFTYYKEGGDTSPAIIDSELYSKMKGDG